MYHPKQIVTRDDVQLDEIILNEVAKQNNGGHQHVDKYDIIICRTNLNNCMMAFLDDAFMVANDNRIVSLFCHDKNSFKFQIYLYIGFEVEQYVSTFQIGYHI